MLTKGKKIELAQNNRQLDIEQERNDILKRQIETEKHLKEEELKLSKENLETKDRIDISLKEYERLKKENEELKEELYKKDKVISNIYESISEEFKKSNIDLSLINKLFNPESKCQVAIFDDPVSCKYQVKILFELNKMENRHS